MKEIKPTLIVYMITTAAAFVRPPLLETTNEFLVSNTLHIENANLNVTIKPPDTQSSDPLHSPSSQRTFIEFPRAQYVDKTDFIREALLSNVDLSSYFSSDHFKQTSILITRPRGFGKTLALSSLYYFCDHSFKNATALFSGLKIMEESEDLHTVREKYMSKFPVIWIDFGTVKYETLAQNIREVKHIISNVFLGYQYLLESKKLSPSAKNRFESLKRESEIDSSVQSSIPFLCECIHKYHNRVPIVLIDNYDVPFHTGYWYNYYKEIGEFMWNFYYHTMQENSFVHRVFLTGVTQIHDTTLYISENTHAFTVLDDDFSKQFGFTDTEVSGLLKRNKSNLQIQALKQKYGEYFYLFNPLSVMNEIFAHKSFAWAKAEPTDPGKVIVEHGLYPLLILQKIMAGKNVEKNSLKYIHLPALKTHELTFWNYLVHEGYVNARPYENYYADYDDEREYVKLIIPNLEVHSKIDSVIKNASSTIPDYKRFTDQLVLGDYAHAQYFIRDYIQGAGRYFWGIGDDQFIDTVIEYVKLMLRGVENRFNKGIVEHGKPYEASEVNVTLSIASRAEIVAPVKIRVQNSPKKGRKEIENLISARKTSDEILILVEGKNIYIHAGTDILSCTETLQKNNN